MTVRSTWQPKKQNLEQKDVVTKEQFLIVLARMQLKDEKETPQEVAPRTAAAAATTEPTTPADFSPPPGLSRPETSKPSTVDEEEEPSKLSQEADGYQVLIRHLPEMMAAEPMMRVILEQAKLDGDLLGMDSRAGGKVLIKFMTLESVKLCVQHFNGRPWGNKGNCVSALYVRTVPRDTQSQTPAARQPEGTTASQSLSAGATAFPASTQQEIVDNTLSANAPVFVPKPASTMSAAATVFVPSLPSKMDTRHRVHSDASTSASVPLSSDDCDLSGSEGGTS